MLADNAGRAQYQPCVWLQADTACPRQKSPIKKGLYAYEDPKTELIVSNFRDLNPTGARPIMEIV